MGGDPLPDAAGRAREALRGAGGQGAQGQRNLSRPQRAADLGRHHRQLAGPAKRAGSARWAWSSRPRRCTRRRSRSMATRSTARPTTAWAFSTTRCRAGRSASATRPRPRSCCRRRWRSIPRASTPTSSTASTWLETRQPDEAVTYLERALQAPARPGRQSGGHRAARGSARPAREDQGRGSWHASASSNGMIDRDTASPSRRVVAQLEPVQGGDALHDGHAQAAAAFLPGPAGGRSARPGVSSCSGESGAPSFSTSSCSAPDAQHHGAARRRIAHRVVQQVAQQHGQQMAVAEQWQRPAARTRAIRTPVRCGGGSASGKAVADRLLDDGCQSISVR